MDKKTFNDLLKDSSLLGSISAQRLADLISQYPYSATLHLLRLKKSFQEDQTDFQELLSKMSAFSPDRNTLYKVLHHRQKQNSSIDSESIVEHKKVDLSRSTSNKVSDVEPDSDSGQELSITKEAKNKTHSEPTTREKDIKSEGEEIKNKGPEKKYEEKTVENSVASDEIAQKNNKLVLPRSEKIRNQSNENRQEPYQNDAVILLPAQAVFRLSDADQSTYHSIKASDEVEIDSLTSMNDLLDGQKEDSNDEKPYKLSRVPVFETDFLDFLDDTASNSTDQKSDSPADSKDEEVTDTEISNTDTSEFISDPSSDVNQSTKDDVLMDDLDSIFQMFAQRSSTSKKSNEWDTGDSSWLQSNPSSEGIISISLAELFVDQGKINEAIEMYRKLSLKFPEKSRLFADEIDKLEQGDESLE